MNKTVYFEPAGRLHSAHREFMRHPPSGYEFVTGGRVWDRLTALPTGSDLIIHNLPVALSKLLPVPLFKAWLEGRFARPPQGVALTFAYNHTVFRDEPWVANVEWVHMLAGFEVKQLRRFRGSIERRFASRRCRKIITWCEAAKRSILLNLDCRGFEEKVEVVPLAVPAKRFAKAGAGERLKLLFVGSANAPRGPVNGCLPGRFLYDFYQKGGQEVLETYVRLKPRYPQLELVMRAGVPPAVKRRFEGVPGIRFIERVVPWPELEREFRSADVFLFPSHQVPPWGVILHAMSYGLPVVATDVYANAELVQDGRTGFIVRASSTVPYYADEERTIPSVVSSRRGDFNRAIRRVDPRVVEELAAKTGLLLDNEELRCKLGRAARREVERGRHSLEARNARLKAIFDEATDGAGD